MGESADCSQGLWIINVCQENQNKHNVHILHITIQTNSFFHSGTVVHKYTSRTGFPNCFPIFPSLIWSCSKGELEIWDRTGPWQCQDLFIINVSSVGMPQGGTPLLGPVLLCKNVLFHLGTFIIPIILNLYAAHLLFGHFWTKTPSRTLDKQEHWIKIILNQKHPKSEKCFH